jgi:hypothetical protein
MPVRKPTNFEMVDDAMAAILRQKTGAERLAIAFRLWDFARDMIRANLRHEHPEWDEERINREAARRLSHGAV